jgi:hypothetical protein
MTEHSPSGFWSRATLALGLAVYAWTMMGVELYLHGAPLPEGPDRGLAIFRRVIMGRAVVGLGGATLLAALVLAGMALARPRQRWATVGAIILAAGWIACLAAVWPI